VIPVGSRDFRYLDDGVEGGPRTKVRANLAAVRLLRQIQAEGRGATRDEQDVLAGYLGWGAFPACSRTTIPSGDGSAPS
jgi:hypothetical protein